MVLRSTQHHGLQLFRFVPLVNQLQRRMIKATSCKCDYMCLKFPIDPTAKQCVVRHACIAGMFVFNETVM